MSEVVVTSEIPNREWLKLTVVLEGQKVVRAHSQAFGPLQLLKAAEKLAVDILGKNVSDCSWEGQSHRLADQMIYECLSKLKNRFVLPYQEEELCHCRMVPAKKVLAAIQVGAHTPEAVKATTQAGSGCGTCRPDVEKMIEFCISNKCTK